MLPRAGFQARSQARSTIRTPPRPDRGALSKEAWLVLVGLALFAVAHVYGAVVIAAAGAPVAPAAILQGD